MKNEFEVLGDTTVIYVTYKDKQEKVFISTEDLPKVQELPNSWRIVYSDGKPYIRGAIYSGKSRVVYGLHQWIMGTYGRKDVVVDHVDHNPFNNERSNLRVVTRGQNAQNRKGAVTGTKSGIRGVSWNERLRKWKANVTVKGVSHYLGYFEDPEEAGRIAKETRKKLMTHTEN
jgi:hypothetical protein